MKTIHTLFLMLLFAANVSAQSILSVNPKEGRRNTFTWLDIQGSNTRFTESSDIAVSLVSNVDGSVLLATNAYASSDTYCYAELRIPATATPGWYTIKVATTNEGILSKANVYRVTNEPPLPEMIGITPSSATNGQTVTTKIVARYAKFLASSSFVVDLSGTTTQLGATSAIALNDTTIQASFTIPSNNRSDVCDVILITDNDYLYLPQAFSISGIDPEITFIAPNSASDGDQVDITIKTTKTELLSIASTINVTLQGDWNYLNATAVTVINDTVLTASFDIPQLAHSDVCNVLVNADGMIVKSQAFTINGINPEVFDVSPAEAEQGTTLDVTISGADMFFTQSSNVNINFYGVNGGSFQGASMVVMNDNQLKTTISIPKNAPVGMYSLNMWVAGNNLTLTEAFNVVEDGLPDPALVSLSPTEASRGQVLDVTITGSGTNFTQSSNLVVYMSGGGYYQATSVTIMNDTKLSCTFNLPSNAQMGLYSVYVNDNLGSYLTLLDGFRITGDATADPVLVSISPAMTFPGHTLDVTITGINTHFMATSTTFDMAIFSQTTYIQPSSFTATSNTTILARFDIPDDFPLGVYDFGISSAVDGFMELLQSVIVNAVGLGEDEGLIGKLYPNPVHDNLYIETQTKVNTCTIIDITGKQIAIDINELKQDQTHLVIPVDKLGLRKGIYFIRLESDSGFDYQKFIVE